MLYRKESSGSWRGGKTDFRHLNHVKENQIIFRRNPYEHQSIRYLDRGTAPGPSQSVIKKGRRPVIVVSDSGTSDGDIISVVPCTGQLEIVTQSTHVFLEEQGLDWPGIALCGQVMALDRSRPLWRAGSVYRDFDRLTLRHALAVQLGLAA